MGKLLTIGQVADHFGVQVWRVRRLFERRLIAEPANRIAAARLFTAADLPRIGKALKAAGYLKEKPAEK